MKLTKVRAGWYATADGRYAVVHEGHGYVNAEWRALGDGNDGWCAVADASGQLRVDHNAGETLAWFDTKRQAVAYLAGHAQG